MSTRLLLPSDLPPENVVALVDTREQLPLDLAPLRMKIGTRTTGDYRLAAAPNAVALERKSLPDLLGSFSSGRERFESELVRLLAYPVRAVVCECSWQQLQEGNWRSKLTPKQISGSILSWQARGIPFIFAGCRSEGQNIVREILYRVARDHYRELRQLVGSGNMEATA